MKKLLLGAITALAILFGFSSCDGGMHNDYIKPWYIEGAVTPGASRTVMKTNSDTGIMSYSFIYDSSTMDGWQSSKGNVHFKIMISASGWLDDFGLEGKSVPINDKDDDGNDKYLPLIPRIGEEDPNHIVISGLTDGEEYTIYIDGDAVANTASIVVKGADAVLDPEFSIISGGASVDKLKMTNEGSGTYTATITAADETYSFKLFDGTTMYGSKKDAIEVGAENEEITPASDAETITVTGLTKGEEYKITFKYTAPYEATIAIKPVKTVELYIVGGITTNNPDGSDKDNNTFVKMTNVTNTELSYTFTYEKSMIGWLEEDDSDRGNGKIAFTITSDVDWNKVFDKVTLTIGDDFVDGFTGEKDNVFVLGLQENATYTITIDASGKTYKGKIAMVDLYIAGEMNNWNFGKMDNDATGYYFAFTEAGTDQQFKVKTVGNWDSDDDTVFATATVSGSIPMDTGDTTKDGDNAKVTANAGDKLYVKYFNKTKDDAGGWKAWVK